MAFAHWNEDADEDLYHYGVNQAEADELFRVKYQAGEFETLSKSKGRCRAWIRLKDGRLFSVEFSKPHATHGDSGKPYIQALELPSGD